MIEEKWPEYRDTQVRSPYATMALKAVGPKTATLATFTMNFQFLGGTVVLLLMSAEMTDSILSEHVHGVRLCEWILIIGFCLLPMTFLGSPVDFWPVAVTAMSATAISSVLVTYSAFSAYDSQVCVVDSFLTSRGRYYSSEERVTICWLRNVTSVFNCYITNTSRILHFYNTNASFIHHFYITHTSIIHHL